MRQPALLSPGAVRVGRQRPPLAICPAEGHVFQRQAKRPSRLIKPVSSLAGLVTGHPPLKIKCHREEESRAPQLEPRDHWAGQGLGLYIPFSSP